MTKTLKVKLIPALALAFLMVVPMFLAIMPVVSASNNDTPVLSVVLSGTRSTTLIPAQSVGSTFSVDVRVDNTSGVSPGINSYSYGLTWNPAVLNVTNVNDAFNGSFLNSGANYGTVESLGDLPANNTEGLLIIGDIILNTSDFAACATGSGVLTTVTFEVKAAGESNIDLQPSDVGVAYLTYPDSQGNSHDIVATTINAVYVSLTPSTSEVGISGLKLIFNTTLANMFANAQSINYGWSYQVYTYNMTTKLPVALVKGGATPTVTGYSVSTGASTVPYGIVVLPTSLSWNSYVEVLSSFVYAFNGANYTAGHSTVLNVHPGDIAGGTLAAPYYGAQGKVNLVSVSLVTGNWLKLGIPWMGTFNPVDALHRADITGQGKVNLVSLSIITGEWLKTW
jgi:hypothetical protein